MIETASIAWALVATVGAVAVYVLMRREVKRARSVIARQVARIATLNAREVRTRAAMQSIQDAASYYSRQWSDAEDRLRQIETQRHNSAKHARAVQLAKAKALRDTKTSELRRDLKASLAEPERQAA